jgi:hypothetical protein
MSVDYHAIPEDVGAGESLPSSCKSQKAVLASRTTLDSMDSQELPLGAEITSAFFVYIGAGRWKVHSAPGKRATFFVNVGPGKWKVQPAVGRTPALADRSHIPIESKQEKLSLRRKNGKLEVSLGVAGSF